MSIPGWYPDPALQPGQFRYWDGTTWSTGTSGNPTDPPPTGPGGPRRRRRTGPVIAAIAVALLIAVVAFVVLRPDPATETTAPTASATAPAQTSEPPTPSEVTPTPSESPSSPGTDPTCAQGEPETRQPHPSDGLVHGGGLAFAPLAGWAADPLPRRLSWAYDVSGQQTPSLTGQPAMVAVGALSTVGGFEAPEQAVDLVLDCMTEPTFYPAFTDRRDIAAQAVEVDGYGGWRIRSIITYGTGSTASIDIVDVIVVDLGAPESLGLFWGSAPVADQGLVRLLDRTVTRLQTD